MARILVVGTADTKGPELMFLRERIRALGGEAVVCDVGTRTPTIAVDIAASLVAAAHPDGAAAVLDQQERGAAVAAMGAAFARFARTQQDINAIMGIGGGGGTSIVTAGMRELPIGVPKLMVSTLASGDVAPFVGVSDIVMMPAVTDLAGLNRISRTILANAAAAIVGMAGAPHEGASTQPAVGLTMFGVTTPCVTAIAAAIAESWEPVVFHATGTGGRTMETLIDSGLLSGAIDITTTEVADLLCGGVLPAGPDRFGAVARSGVPCVLSAGACDMVNFWAPETIPERYRGRTFHRHNPNVTLMRTNAEECAAIGRWMGERLNAFTGPLRVLLPLGGISGLDIEGGPFFDPAADAALFEALGQAVDWSAGRVLRKLPAHINAPEFARAAVEAWREIAG